MDILQDTSFKKKPFGAKKEVNELSNILKDNESLDYIVSGLNDGNTWLIAVTSLRPIFLDKGLLYGLKQKEVMLDKISAINFQKGLLFAKLFIEDSRLRSIKIEQIFKNDIDNLIKYFIYLNS